MSLAIPFKHTHTEQTPHRHLHSSPTLNSSARVIFFLSMTPYFEPFPSSLFPCSRFHCLLSALGCPHGQPLPCKQGTSFPLPSSVNYSDLEVDAGALGVQFIKCSRQRGLGWAISPSKLWSTTALNQISNGDPEVKGSVFHYQSPE